MHRDASHQRKLIRGGGAALVNESRYIGSRILASPSENAAHDILQDYLISESSLVLDTMSASTIRTTGTSDPTDLATIFEKLNYGLAPEAPNVVQVISKMLTC